MRKILCIALLALAGCCSFNSQAIHDAFDQEMEFATRYEAWVNDQVATGKKTAEWGDAEKAVLKAHVDLVKALESAAK